MDADGWARRLASGDAIDARFAIVVAHPDDETLWTGALLARARDEPRAGAGVGAEALDGLGPPHERRALG